MKEFVTHAGAGLCAEPEYEEVVEPRVRACRRFDTAADHDVRLAVALAGATLITQMQRHAIIGFEQQTHVQLRGARCTCDTVAAPAQHVPAQMRPVEAAATDAEDDAFAERGASKIAQPLDFDVERQPE